MIVNEAALGVYLLVVASGVAGYFAGKYHGFREGQELIWGHFRAQAEKFEAERLREEEYARAATD
jgi:hypothetical protein